LMPGGLSVVVRIRRLWAGTLRMGIGILCLLVSFLGTLIRCRRVGGVWVMVLEGYWGGLSEVGGLGDD